MHSCYIPFKIHTDTFLWIDIKRSNSKKMNFFLKQGTYHELSQSLLWNVFTPCRTQHELKSSPNWNNGRTAHSKKRRWNKTFNTSTWKHVL